MKIVSDGPERLREATKDRRAKREEEIRAELFELAKPNYEMAGFVQRLWIRYRMGAELRRRLDSEFPRSECLHLLAQK
jgi:hypothetical protein